MTEAKKNPCCCHNGHKPVDGFISTDPACDVHGTPTYNDRFQSLLDSDELIPQIEIQKRKN